MEMENQYLVTIIVIDSGEIINRYLDLWVNEERIIDKISEYISP